MESHEAEEVRVETSAHQAHRALILALFRSRPHQVVSWQELDRLVGANFMQRISEARRGEDGLKIECVPRYAEIDGRRKRITGDYRWRPEALGRDAADYAAYKPCSLFDGAPGAFQR